MVHPRGISVLHEPVESELDIVFVHGFTGHPKSTWTLDKTKVRKRRHQDDSESPQSSSKLPRIHSFAFSRSRLSQTKTSTSTGPDQPSIPTSEAAIEKSRLPSSTSHTERYEEVYWPEDLLPSTAPTARILTYGYDTKIKHFVQGQVSKNTVQDHGWDLLCALEAKRRTSSESSRPLVLIAHSLGGLVVKHMLKQAHDRASTHPHLHNVFDSTIAVLFFGTPHRGADPRTFFHHVLSISAQGLGVGVNKQIVATLLPNGESASNFADFTALVCQQNWTIYSFQEEYGVSGLFGKKVVDDQSSTLSLPTVETVQHIGDNHMDMCRFFGLNDPEYQKVDAALKRILIHIPPIATPAESSKDEVLGDDLPHDPSNGSIPNHEHPPEDVLPPETKKLLTDFLRFDQMDARLMTLRTAQAKTCEWFLSNPEYAQWQSTSETKDHNGFLWIKGKPGTGKSVLMKYLFSEAQKSWKKRARKRPIIISFFFNARGEQLEKSTLGCYRSLLLQLFEKAPELQVAMDHLGSSGARFIEKNGWNIEILTQTLASAVGLLSSGRPLKCFVDALDECEEWEVRNMVSFFEDLEDRIAASKPSIHICFSSRHYPSIVPKKGLQVTLEAEIDHFHDISRFVEAELRLGDSEQNEEIKAAIMAKCSNIFLWASLVVPILNREYARGRMPAAIRKCLDSIPPGLDELFDMILTRDNDDLEELRLCLKWVLFSSRPLRPQELYIAIQIGLCLGSTPPEEPETEYPQRFSTSDLRRYIDSSSKGLAEITRSEKPTVQFIHESVRDFLLGKSGKRSRWSGFEPHALGETHDFLKRCCLAQVTSGYLAHFPANSLGGPGTKTVRLKNAKHPFLEYAVENVLRHSDLAEQWRTSQLPFLQDFPLQEWITLYNLFETHEIRRYPTDANLVYILANYDLSCLIRIHPDSPRHFEIRGGRYGYPLLAAIVLRNIKAIEALLATTGLQVTASSLNLDGLPTRSFRFDLENKDILSGLAEFDQHLMLQHCWEVSRQSRENCAQPHCNSGVETVGSSPRTIDRSLFFARSATMVAILVGIGADPGAQDERGTTVLCSAAGQGYLEVVKLLSSPRGILKSSEALFPQSLISKIEDRVDTNSRDTRGRTPLHFAVCGGFDEIVKHLISLPLVDFDARDNIGLAALDLAFQFGRPGVLESILCCQRLNPNMQTVKGVTPLGIATGYGLQHAVQALVARLLPSDQNCMQLAEFLIQFRPSDDVEEMILKFGKDKMLVNIRNDEGLTPLSSLVHAVYAFEHRLFPDRLKNPPSNVLPRIERYLRFKADPNIKDQTGRSAISYAASIYSYPLAVLLRHSGPSADFSPDKDGDTPFHHAARFQTDNLELLFRHAPSLVDTKNGVGKTPLWLLLYRISRSPYEHALRTAHMLVDRGKLDLFSRNQIDSMSPYDLIRHIALWDKTWPSSRPLAISLLIQVEEMRPPSYNISGTCRACKDVDDMHRQQ